MSTCARPRRYEMVVLLRPDPETHMEDDFTVEWPMKVRVTAPTEEDARREVVHRAASVQHLISGIQEIHLL